MYSFRETTIQATSSSHIEVRINKKKKVIFIITMVIQGTTNGYSIFHHEGNNWKPSEDGEYSNLEVIIAHLLMSEFNVKWLLRVSR